MSELEWPPWDEYFIHEYDGEGGTILHRVDMCPRCTALVLDRDRHEIVCWRLA